MLYGLTTCAKDLVWLIFDLISSILFASPIGDYPKCGLLCFVAQFS